MQDKLQQLTDKLYSEGLSKGREEGEQILANAKAEAEKIIASAKAEANSITAKAEHDADALRAKAEKDVKDASEQALSATRKDLENLVIAKISDKQVSDSLTDKDYLKKVILAVAEKFSAQESADIALVLPESLKAELEPFVKGELAKTLGKDVKAEYSRKISGGFTIAPKDGRYFISLSDETFRELISEYLRPATRKILFG